MLSFFTRISNCKLLSKVMMAIALSVCLPSLSMATISVVKESSVENCSFLGKIEGSSGYGKKNVGWGPLAKSSAIRRAEKLGASHVVWERMDRVGVFNGRAIARAYSCSN